MDDGSTAVGVVGEDAAALAERVDPGGPVAGVDDAASVTGADVDAVVAVDESGLLAVARERPEVPVLPVDAGRGVRSVARDDVEAAVDHLAGGEATSEHHPSLTVRLGGESVTTAFLDVALVTAEVAHISEFGIEFTGGATAFRADGVVLATPAGSTGYAGRVGAPVLVPGADVVALAPIAPFATDPDRWVVPADDVRLGVERDEVAVSLLADDRRVGPVGVDDDVLVDADGTVEVAVVPESRPRFD